LIELREVSHSYEGKLVLKDISVRVGMGEKVVLLGINGSGKTTLLKILNALFFPDRGKYLYFGEEVSKKRLRDRSFKRRFRSEVALLFQNPDVMLFNPTVYDELAFSLRQLGYDEGKVRERVLLWAEVFGLLPHIKRPPFELSGGEKQKLCLACLMVLEPKVLLLDEPTAHLDPRTTGWFIDLLWEFKGMVITSTHNLSLAEELGSRLLVLGEDHGLLYDGPVKEFLKDKEKLLKAGLLHRHGGKDYHLHSF